MTKKSEKLEKTQNVPEALDKLESKEDLKNFLLMVTRLMDENQAPPVYVLNLMNHLLTLPEAYELFDEENKELSRAIWLRMKQFGMQVKNPPMLFGQEETQS